MNINLKNMSLLPKQLIGIIGALLVIFLILNIIAYTISARLSYINQIQESNDLTVAQIGISYETMLSYMADTINKIAIFDFSAYDLESATTNFFDFSTSINSELNSIVALNSYIHSAYIYIPDLNRIYNSRTNYPRITSLDSFDDKYIFIDNQPNYLSFLPPRLLPSGPNMDYSSSKAVIGIMSPIALKNSTQNSYITINISVDNLYNTILRNISMSKEVTLFAYNQDNMIVLHNNDKTRLFSTLKENDISELSEKASIIRSPRALVSTYYSSYLNWTFVLEAPVTISTPIVNGFTGISVLSVLFIILVISYIIVKKTRPVNKMALALSDSLWKDCLLDNIPIDDHIMLQFASKNFNPRHGSFGVLTLIGGISMLDIVKKDLCLKTDVRTKVLQTEKNLVAIVVAIDGNLENTEDVLSNMANEIYNGLSLRDINDCYIGLSGAAKKFPLLPLAYKEAATALNYKICMNSYILPYSVIKNADVSFEFPTEQVRQLTNNITVGNQEACIGYIDRIFLPFEQKLILIEDTQFINLVISLQNTVLKTISGLLIPVKIDVDLSSGQHNLNKIKEELVKFTAKICLEVNRIDENQEYALFSAIMQYIDQHYLTESLSLTQLADALNMNKNYLSKIVKEMTGCTFNEYVNKKRVVYSKELLKNKQKTIEEISAEIGFNYSYYFIKIFKSIEGITPGQYRNLIANESESKIAEADKDGKGK